jgi:hypothetical protein
MSVPVFAELNILPSGKALANQSWHIFRLLRHGQGIRGDLNPRHSEPIFAVFHGILWGPYPTID